MEFKVGEIGVAKVAFIVDVDDDIVAAVCHGRGVCLVKV